MNIIHDAISIKATWDELYAIKQALQIAIARFDYPDAYGGGIHPQLKLWKNILGEIHV